MGHYASEMQCDDCGHLRCICPTPPDETLGKWMLDSKFRVVKSDTMPWIVRLHCTLYDTKKAATAAIPDEIKATIEAENTKHAARIEFLKDLLMTATHREMQ